MDNPHSVFKKGFPPTVVVLLTCILGICFQLFLSSPTIHFHDFHSLEWDTLEGCTPDGTPPTLSTHTRGVGTYDVRYPAQERSCKSQNFIASARELTLEVSADSETQESGRLELYNGNEQLVASAALPTEFNGRWESLKFEIPESLVGTSVYIVLRQSTASGWIAARDRLSFFQPSTASTTLERIKTIPGANLLLVLALTALLTRYCYWLMDSETSEYAFFCHLFLIAFLIHFRLDSFIFWDEWNIFDRFRTEGLSGIFHIHNEHFIPLFLAFYFLESILFGTTYQGYVLVSILLHAANAMLLCSILRTLSGSRTAARLLALAFALSGLHSEVLHWAFEQSILLSQLCIFLAIHQAIRFFQDGTKSRLWLIAVFSLLAPLFFGNGFIVVGQIALLLVFLLLNTRSTTPTMTRFRRVVSATLSSSCVLVVPTTLYFVARNNVEQPFLTTNPFRNMSALIDYLFVGTQLGSVLRGFGIFPSLLLDQAAPQALRSVAWFVPDTLLFWTSPEMICASVGAAFGLALLVLSLLGRRKGEAVLLWSLGQLLLVVAFILPSLVRWQIGSFQALALRYQYSAFIGLCCVALPALLYFLSCRRYDLENGDSSIARVFRITLAAAVFFHVGINVYRSQQFSFFTENGRANMAYIEELADWRKRLQSHSIDTYEAVGSPIYGLQPLYPTTLTPREYPVDTYEVLNWLNPWKYQ